MGVGTTVYDFNTLTADTSPGSYGFYYGTDSSGTINQWGISLTLLSNGLGLNSRNPVASGSAFDELTGAPNGLFLVGNNKGPGVWSSAASATPEPSTLLLFGTGLLGVVGAVRRKWLHAS